MARALACKRLWRRRRVAGQPGLLCSGLCFPTRNLNQIQCNPTRKSQWLPSLLSATFLGFLNSINAGWEWQSLWDVEVERLGLAQGQQPQNHRGGNAAWYLPSIPEALGLISSNTATQVHALPLSYRAWLCWNMAGAHRTSEHSMYHCQGPCIRSENESGRMKILTLEKLKFRFAKKEEQLRVLLDVCWVGSFPRRGNRERVTEHWKGVDCVLGEGHQQRWSLWINILEIFNCI